MASNPAQNSTAATRIWFITSGPYIVGIGNGYPSLPAPDADTSRTAVRATLVEGTRVAHTGRAKSQETQYDCPHALGCHHRGSWTGRCHAGHSASSLRLANAADRFRSL